jgi:hypothetical protein
LFQKLKEQHDAARSGPSRLSIVLTALVWPGFGQLLQKRWAAGLLYAFGFLGCAAWFFVEAFLILRVYYGLWFDFDANQAPPPLPLRGLLLSFALGLLVYFVALLDSYLGYVRQRSAWNARQRKLEIPTPEPE